MWCSTDALAIDSDFVGSRTCSQCHAEQFMQWQPSQHKQAMQIANDETVLGNFNQAEFDNGDTRTQFYRKDQRFFVQTQGADGTDQEFEVLYTFGIYPLQQYLVSMPRGHFQALSIAWDSRSADEGGQRWFHLDGPEPVSSDDPLHWTGPYLRWNSRCAECHSTAISKNYDEETDSYRTSWREISVGCEACHGPGSRHVAVAQTEQLESSLYSGFEKPLPHATQFGFADGETTAQAIQRHGTDTSAEGTDTPAQGTDTPAQGTDTSAEGTDTAQIDMCASCHSRRGMLREWRHDDHYFDSHLPALLDPPLYHPDGQILDEVYVYGSFVQSLMFQRGVQCTNCHEPHDLSLKVEGDGVCFQCHRPDAFATNTHHRHESDSAGARCVNCHMPEQTYMVVDPRRDHSLRVPNPWLADRTGGVDACTLCHEEKDASWAAGAMETWGLSEPKSHFASLLAHTTVDHASASAARLQLAANDSVPPIVRATALANFIAENDHDLAMIASQLRDAEPLVRIGAVRSANNLDEGYRRAMLWPLLDDEVRAVRNEAARALAETPREQITEAQLMQLDAALDAYIESQGVMADMAAAQLNIAQVELTRNRFEAAERAYQFAVRNEPANIAARLNYADYLRQQGRDQEGLKHILAALDVAPQEGSVNHAYGLLLVRLGETEKALHHLGIAARAVPEAGRYTYVYAVALSSVGRLAESAKVAEKLRLREPANLENLELLLSLYQRQGERSKFQQRMQEYKRLTSPSRSAH